MQHDHINNITKTSSVWIFPLGYRRKVTAPPNHGYTFNKKVFIKTLFIKAVETVMQDEVDSRLRTSSDHHFPMRPCDMIWMTWQLRAHRRTVGGFGDTSGFQVVRKCPFSVSCSFLSGSGGLRSRPSRQKRIHPGVLSKNVCVAAFKNHHSELSLTFHRLCTSRQYKRGIQPQ